MARAELLFPGPRGRRQKSALTPPSPPAPGRCYTPRFTHAHPALDLFSVRDKTVRGPELPDEIVALRLPGGGEFPAGGGGTDTVDILFYPPPPEASDYFAPPPPAPQCFLIL